MDKHFNRNCKRICVAYWGGKTIPSYIMSIINNNASFFDEFYFLLDDNETPEQELYMHKSIHLIYLKDKYISDFVGPKFDDFLGTYAAKSDIVCHYAKSLLNELADTSYDKVMYIDANTIITSQFRVNELFWKYPTKNFIYYTKAQNKYLWGMDYLNSDFSLDCKDGSKDFDHIELLYDIALGNPIKYTSLGPSSMNKEKFRECECLFVIDNLTIELVCPINITPLVTLPVTGDRMGYCLYPSLYKSVDKLIKEVFICEDNIKIVFDDK
jgi:hypothetical protein